MTPRNWIVSLHNKVCHECKGMLEGVMWLVPLLKGDNVLRVREPEVVCTVDGDLGILEL